MISFAASPPKATVLSALYWQTNAAGPMVGGILFFRYKDLIFDYFGSMIEGIERYFRSFGAVPVPYYRVRKLRFPFSWMPSLRD
jgi:hypothetical protein